MEAAYKRKRRTMIRLIPVQKKEQRRAATAAPQEEGALAPAYSDFDDKPIDNYREIDVLSQLKANVTQLENLHFKLNYLISEIRGVVKK